MKHRRVDCSQRGNGTKSHERKNRSKTIMTTQQNNSTSARLDKCQYISGHNMSSDFIAAGNRHNMPNNMAQYEHTKCASAIAWGKTIHEYNISNMASS